MAAIEAHNTQLGVLPLQVHPAHDRLQHHKPTDVSHGYGVFVLYATATSK